MAQDLEALNQMIARLQGIPDLVQSVLPECAAECHAVIAENVAAQVGPDGEAWAPGNDGKPVLQNAAAAVTALAIGNVILLRVSGPEAKHHLGIAKGKVQRRIIPTRKAPQAMTKAIERVIMRRLAAPK